MPVPIDSPADVPHAAHAARSEAEAAEARLDASDVEPASEHGLSADLRRLLDRAAGGPMALNDMLGTLGDRGHAVAIILLTAPFLVLPVPGLSTAFGAAVFLIGACVTLGLRPRLPGFVGRREISYEALCRLVAGAERILSRVERLVRPRLAWLSHRAGHWLIGLSLCLAAVALALPIPIPWNNVPPAVVLMFLAFGLLERDGVALLIGHALNVILWVLLIVFGRFILELIAAGIDRVFG